MLVQVIVDELLEDFCGTTLLDSVPFVSSATDPSEYNSAQKLLVGHDVDCMSLLGGGVR